MELYKVAVKEPGIDIMGGDGNMICGSLTMNYPAAELRGISS